MTDQPSDQSPSEAVEQKTETPEPKPAPERPLGKPEDWPEEVGGPKGAEPTRFNDWEKNGRCSDF
ncbi:MAG: DUF1674 domain-containing protein [Rhodospirillaceae bacterium]